VFSIRSVNEDFIRIQPIADALIEADIDTNANSVSEWIYEWFNMIRYGPTYKTFKWSLDGTTTQSSRLQLKGSIEISVNWGDQSVNWENRIDGVWNCDISKVTEVTIFLKSDIGEYQQKHTSSGPATVSSVHLKPYLEIACDESVPFSLEKQPIASIFYSKSINLDNIINPKKRSK
jgi:hypothetical protein